MKKNKKIHIVSYEKYGNTDFCEFSYYASKNGYSVEFLCLGKKEGLNFYPKIIELNYLKFRFLSRFLFILSVVFYFRHGKDKQSSLIHIRYFKGSCILGLLLSGNVICDIRSGPLSENKVMNNILLYLMRFECGFFSNTSIISKSLANKLNLERYKLLPLGASRSLLNLKAKRKNLNSKFKFIYVGVFDKRNIDFFLTQFNVFVLKNNLDWSIDIFGYGSQSELKKILEIDKSCSFINFKGYLDRKEFQETLMNYDIGVSYVPIIDTFDCQPPTKTFEYLMANLPVLATSTYENRLIVSNSNGWLCNTETHSINSALNYIKNSDISKLEPRRGMNIHTWDSIFEHYYSDLINDNA